MKSISMSAKEAENAEVGQLEDQVGYRLRVAQDAFAQSMKKHAKGFAPGKIAVLTAIDRKPGLSQTELSNLSQRDKSTITPAINSLEKQGLIRRERVDQRTYAVYLTPSGKNVLQSLLVGAQNHEDRVEAMMGQKKKRELLCLLKELAEKLQEQVL